jgi:puromycin-sensitive aminopeptidase/glutamyl aminopeptidase
VNDLQYAADTAAAILPAYEQALGVQFPLPKLDLVVRRGVETMGN